LFGVGFLLRVRVSGGKDSFGVGKFMFSPRDRRGLCIIKDMNICYYELRLVLLELGVGRSGIIGK